MNLDFLKNVQLTEAETKSRRSGITKSKYPDEADIRVYKNGEVYPSPALVKAWGLAYGNKPEPVQVGDKMVTPGPSGNGIDLIDSRNWAQAASLPQPVIFAAACPRSQGRVDLFGSTSYTEDGKPASDVLTQGATTAGKNLLVMLKEVYGIEPDETTGFIDLKIMTEQEPLRTQSGIYNIPKTIRRGDKQGEVSYVRREKIDIYALVPYSFLTGNQPQGAVRAEEQQQTAGPALMHEPIAQ
jgi:hypothetical protein